MGRTLFIGDSHSCGYHVDSKGVATKWDDNNYAEIYAKHFNKPVVIYAMPGGSNRKYPLWVKSMFDRYNDIDEVFIQSTYWNRYLVAASKLNNFVVELGTDHFLDDTCKKDDLVHRYTDLKYKDDYLEVVEQIRPENVTRFKGIEYDRASTDYLWAPLQEKYHYTKTWHELTTHLQHRDYCLDLLAIDTMCKERNIIWYLWNMNDNCTLPDNINLFSKITPIRKNISAVKYLENRLIKTQSHKLDTEHYDRFIHEKIATEFLSNLKKTVDKT